MIELHNIYPCNVLMYIYLSFQLDLYHRYMTTLHVFHRWMTSSQLTALFNSPCIVLILCSSVVELY